MSDEDSDNSSLFEGATSVSEDTNIQVEGFVDLDSPKYDARRQSRQEYPAPVSWLVETNSDRLMIDWAVEQYLRGNQQSYSKSELSEEVGLARRTVQRRIDKMAEIGVLAFDDSQHYKQYYVADTPVVRALVALNEAVLTAYPDDPTQLPEE